MVSTTASGPHAVDEKTYNRRVLAWTLYDWGNSAFATTILAAILPAYYSSVAGATLSSEATATAYWSLGLSLSLFAIAILSPILGTISDVKRNKKPMLAFFAGLGVVTTGLLVLVGTGDWMLASLLFVFGRIGFTGANVFYDSLLPHVARDDDQDRVSTTGFAMGYLGGGLLLALNVVMMQVIPDTWFEYAGIRLSFLSVAIWWGLFTIPVLRAVPEPPTSAAKLKEGENVLTASFSQLRDTLRDVRQYSELFKFLLSFLIYNDGIGTIIGVAVIYGAELGFGTTELVLALLMVQFAGIPFSLIFGRLPSKAAQRRPYYLAFIVFNIVALPVVATGLLNTLDLDVSGAPPDPYLSTETAFGEGIYGIPEADALQLNGTWEQDFIPAADMNEDADVAYAYTSEAGDMFSLTYNGQDLNLIYNTGPDGGLWDAVITDVDGNEVLALTIDSYNRTVRYGAWKKIVIDDAPAGEFMLTVTNSGEADPDSTGTLMNIARIEVLQPKRISNLPLILGSLLAVQAVGILFAFLTGKRFFGAFAETLNTKRSVILALVVYSVVAIWAYFIDSVVEFWYLAWMVAIVQGGSQALSRSLYASMSPASKSGEFFGLFGVMEKFSAIIGPLIFAGAVAAFGNSRPAIVSLIVLFIVGGWLLTRVDVEEGRRVAQAEDAAAAALNA